MGGANKVGGGVTSRVDEAWDRNRRVGVASMKLGGASIGREAIVQQRVYSGGGWVFVEGKKGGIRGWADGMGGGRGGAHLRGRVWWCLELWCHRCTSSN